MELLIEPSDDGGNRANDEDALGEQSQTLPATRTLLLEWRQRTSPKSPPEHPPPQENDPKNAA